LNPEQPPPTTEIRSPLGAGSWELMISFTLPIAFSVICTIIVYLLLDCREVPGPIIPTGPHHSNLQSLGWRIVGFGRGKIDLEQRRGPKSSCAGPVTRPPGRAIVQSVSAETLQWQYASIAVYGNTHRRTSDPGVR